MEKSFSKYIQSKNPALEGNRKCFSGRNLLNFLCFLFLLLALVGPHFSSLL